MFGVRVGMGFKQGGLSKAHSPDATAERHGWLGRSSGGKGCPSAVLLCCESLLDAFGSGLLHESKARAPVETRQRKANSDLKIPG